MSAEKPNPACWCQPAPPGTTGKVNEEPMRLFAGLGLAEDTNARFKYLNTHQKSLRLSTAFDGPTLYGLDSDPRGRARQGGEARGHRHGRGHDHGCSPASPDALRCVRLDDDERARAGHLAMFIASAKRRFGPDAVANLRGTIQADMLKEVQAQNEVIFPSTPRSVSCAT